MFEFEEQKCKDSLSAGKKLVEKVLPEAFTPVPAVVSPVPKSGGSLVIFQDLQLVKALSHQKLIFSVIVGTTAA